MKRSSNRIISSHAGTLPRPEGFPEVFFGAVENPAEFYSRLPGAIKDVVKRQVEMGIDVVNDGEFGKLGGFSNYVRPRLGGLEAREGEKVTSHSVSARDQ